MSIYLLHVIYDGHETVTDTEGAEFEDDFAAIAEAHRGLRELLAFSIEFASEAPKAIQVVNKEGAEIGMIARRDLIPASWFSVQ